jgi:hypothetical protein
VSSGEVSGGGGVWHCLARVACAGALVCPGQFSVSVHHYGDSGRGRGDFRTMGVARKDT